jgi:hypothetical protein
MDIVERQDEPFCDSIPFIFSALRSTGIYGDLAHESYYLRVALRPGTQAHWDLTGHVGESLFVNIEY